MPDILIIEPCDFEDFPVGGQLSFVKHMMAAFGNRLALVGISTDGTPIGRWVEKRFAGSDYQFFAFGHRRASSSKPLIPARITAYLDIIRHRRAIMSIGIRYAFTQAPEALMAVHSWPWDSICYMSPGHANPLKMARYRWAKPFAGLYDMMLYSALQDVDVILACADQSAIEDFASRSRGLLGPKQITQFPTRVDMAIFKPLPSPEIRQKLNLNGTGPFVVTCGRINKVKGWDLLIQAFKLFMHRHQHARLVFVGEGEDRQALQQAIKKQSFSESVLITGFQPPAMVAQYLNAADVVVIGSYKEGWSIAMLEALACGRAVVSTDVSGARDMIVDGQNGFVIPSRDPKRFAAAMTEALAIETPNQMSLRIADKYSLANLGHDLSLNWKPLAGLLVESDCTEPV